MSSNYAAGKLGSYFPLDNILLMDCSWLFSPQQIFFIVIWYETTAAVGDGAELLSSAVATWRILNSAHAFTS